MPGSGGLTYDTTSGLYYLRARYYDPSTAQFLTVDPMVATTMSPYAYVAGNPLNASDPSGMCLGWIWGASDCQFDPGQVVNDPGAAVHQIQQTAAPVLDIAAVPFYATYYVNYNIGNSITSKGCGVAGAFHDVACSAAHIAALPTVPGQIIGGGGDVAIDTLKGESICDEGKNGYINPLHSYLPSWLQGPQVYLPGIHSNGSVDLAW